MAASKSRKEASEETKLTKMLSWIFSFRSCEGVMPITKEIQFALICYENPSKLGNSGFEVE